ncbi:MAG: hypothetical protein QXW04_00860 [Candidatus Aenigmatarchaeota archaeon]
MRAFLWSIDAQENIRCKLCLKKCLITKKKPSGFCKVRKRRENILIVTNYMRIKYLEDEIENLHFLHFKPFNKVLVINSIGTNCNFCSMEITEDELKKIEIEKFIDEIKQKNYKILFFYQQEPIIFFETMYKIAKYAFRAGLINVFSTNAYFLPILSKLFKKYFSAVQVRVYNFLDEDFYKRIGLEDTKTLKKTILYLYRQKLHMEILNIINEEYKKEKLVEFSEFIINDLSSSIPFHIYYPNNENIYELLELKDLAERTGLRFVYINDERNVLCYNCKSIIIDRENKTINLNSSYRCPNCLAKVELIL